MEYLDCIEDGNLEFLEHLHIEGLILDYLIHSDPILKIQTFL